MARWEPDAAGRLHQAALDLYVAQGYEKTTVAEIAERAGVTARTYFRHFADKREVLFARTSLLEDGMLEALLAAPATASALEAVGAALDAAGALIGGDHAHSRRRASVIDANPELLERELIKMSRIASALADGLVSRGVPATEARLAAETGTAVFRIGFESWVAGPSTASLAAGLREALAQLRALAG